MKDHSECNKFKGFKYYAISSKQEVIAEGYDPEYVRMEAIIKGEMCPIVIGSNTIIKHEDSKETQNV